MQSHADRYLFRWARPFGVVLLVAAVWMVVGVAAMLFGALAGGDALWILVGVPPLSFAAAFVAVFGAKLRSATVEATRDGLRIFFPLSVETTIPFANIIAARVVNHRVLYGLGIRTNLMGHAALATAWGPAAEFDLHEPVRVGILPVIWWTHARKLRLTVENPEELVAFANAMIDPARSEGVRP